MSCLELAVEAGEGRPHLGGGAHRPQRVVLVDARNAEDRHDGVADELLDRAAVALEGRSCIAAKYRDIDRASASGSICSPSVRRARHVGEDDGDDLADLDVKATADRQFDERLEPWTVGAFSGIVLVIADVIAVRLDTSPACVASRCRI